MPEGIEEGVVAKASGMNVRMSITGSATKKTNIFKSFEFIFFSFSIF